MTLPLNTLKGQIQEDVKSAMRARDQKRLTALRLITAAIKQVEIDQRIEMDDTAVLAVLDKMVKQRRDSLEQYTTGASSIRDMGAVMNKLRPQVQGRADMKAVSNAVKQQLGA